MGRTSTKKDRRKRFEDALATGDTTIISELNERNMPELSKSMYIRSDLFGQHVAEQATPEFFKAWLVREREVSSVYGKRAKPGIMFQDGIEMAFCRGVWNKQKWADWSDEIGSLLPDQQRTSNNRLFANIAPENFQAAKDMLSKVGLYGVAHTSYMIASMLGQLTKRDYDWGKKDYEPVNKVAQRSARHLFMEICRSVQGADKLNVSPMMFGVLFNDNGGLEVGKPRVNSLLETMFYKQMSFVGESAGESIFFLANQDDLNERGWNILCQVGPWTISPKSWTDNRKTTWKSHGEYDIFTPLEIMISKCPSSNSAEKLFEFAKKNGATIDDLLHAISKVPLRGIGSSTLPKAEEKDTTPTARLIELALPDVDKNNGVEWVDSRIAEWRKTNSPKSLLNIVVSATKALNHRFNLDKNMFPPDLISQYDATCLLDKQHQKNPLQNGKRQTI